MYLRNRLKKTKQNKKNNNTENTTEGSDYTQTQNGKKNKYTTKTRKITVHVAVLWGKLFFLL